MHRSGWGKFVQTGRAIWTHPPNRGRRVRRLGAWIGWQVWERTVRRPWRIRFTEDLRITLHPHDFISSGVLYFGLPDHELMSFQRSWLRANGGNFVDMGANVGLYSLYASTVPGVRSIAFEPGTVAFERARVNVRDNGLSGVITLVRAAVSDTEGCALLTTRWGGMNYLVAGESGGQLEHGEVEPVRTIRFDDYDAAAGLGAVGLIKVDVEGHEVPALLGAECVIRRDRPALIVELNYGDELRELAERLGYEPVTYHPENGHLERRPWPTTPPDNVILVPGSEITQRLPPL